MPNHPTKQGSRQALALVRDAEPPHAYISQLAGRLAPVIAHTRKRDNDGLAGGCLHHHKAMYVYFILPNKRRMYMYVLGEYRF